MKSGVVAIFLASVLFQTCFAIEEAEVKAPQKIKISSDSTEIIPISSSKRRSKDDEETFSRSLDLRQRKRVAIGVQALGKFGIIGANLDLNLSAHNSAGGFVGSGQGFNTFGFSWRKYLEGDRLTPFFGFSLARWYNASEKNKEVSSSTPSYLANDLLNREEKTSGKYSLNMLAPNMGLQYFFLDGELKNSSITGELVLLKPIDRSANIVTASFGYNYSF